MIRWWVTPGVRDMADVAEQRDMRAPMPSTTPMRRAVRRARRQRSAILARSLDSLVMFRLRSLSRSLAAERPQRAGCTMPAARSLPHGS